MRLSVLLPCYNEEEAIQSVIQDLLSQKENILSLSEISHLEIIVCDDGSSDNSFKLLKEFTPEIKIISHKQNKGYGMALKTCIKESSGEICVLYDLDDTCRASNIITLLKEYFIRNVDMVVGNRLHEDSSMPQLRVIGNTFYAKIVGLIFKKNLTDVCSGYRLVRKDYVLSILDKLPDDLTFTLTLTLNFLVNHKEFAQCDVLYQDRKGISKLSVVQGGFKFLRTILFYKE